MADDLAGFLFDHATLLMPVLIAVSLAVIFLFVRRWPKSLWRRLGAAVLSLALAVVALVAGGLLYAERNIRAIVTHRVNGLRLHPIRGTSPQRVADLHGKVVVVNFWATWCPPCRAEMPDLNRLADHYPTDVRVLTITDETPDRIALYERKIIALRTVVATFESDQPHGALAVAAYQGRPTTVVLDRDGNVQDIFIGKQTFARLQQSVERQVRRGA